MTDRFESWTKAEAHDTVSIDIPDINPLVTLVTPGGTVIQFFGIPGTPVTITSGDIPEVMAVRVQPGENYPGGKPVSKSLAEVKISAPTRQTRKGVHRGH